MLLFYVHLVWVIYFPRWNQHQIVLYILTLDQYEWTKYKSHSNDFHCLSHTTLVSGPEDTGMWPFVFESGLKIADQVYEISKGESNLAYDKDHNKDNERPMQGNSSLKRKLPKKGSNT